jgi:hypothetical protein
LLEVALTLFILGLIIVTGWAAAENVAQGGWSADAAGWAQAAGSIIAIAGAGWLARSEAREARSYRRRHGEEAAWHVRFVVSQSQVDAQIIAAELTAPDAAITANDTKSWRQRAANSALALSTMLTRADHIHPAVVLTACNAKILIEWLEKDLVRLEETVATDDIIGEDLLSDIVGAHLNLAELLEQYDARIRGVKLALDRGRDMLPIEEREEWRF